MVDSRIKTQITSQQTMQVIIHYLMLDITANLAHKMNQVVLPKLRTHLLDALRIPEISVDSAGVILQDIMAFIDCYMVEPGWEMKLEPHSLKVCG